MASSANGAAINIPVRLTSRVPNSKYAIPDSKFFIPADWKRFQLSELINKVLKHDEPVPFDFVISDQLLRSSLGDYLSSKGQSIEDVLEIEYVESTLPPKFQASFPHEDWISSVDLSQKGMFLTSSYDGQARVFTSTSGDKPTQIWSGHRMPVLSTCWMPSGSPEKLSDSIVTGGMDRVARVWHKTSTTHALHLHNAPISSVHASKTAGLQGARQVLTAGWDGLVALWDIHESAPKAQGGLIESDDDEEGSRRKKRRRANDSSVNVAKVKPTLVMRNHAGVICRAIFDKTDAGKAYSAGTDDHTIRSWDLDAGGVETDVKNSDKSILGLAQLASRNLLVTGSTDRTVCLWDTRDASTNVATTLLGHTSQVTCVAAHPTSSLLFASGSYDTTVKIWDARSPNQSLFTLARTTQQKGDGKIVCIDWDGEIVAVGGEDKTLEIFKGVSA